MRQAFRRGAALCSFAYVSVGIGDLAVLLTIPPRTQTKRTLHDCTTRQGKKSLLKAQLKAVFPLCS